MMDMEMNADLDRDGGSEGEASYEGSSAGSVYCTLEQDFARITSEMKENENLALYYAEYTRLFEALYKAHRLEEDLTAKVKVLNDALTSGSSRVTELERAVEKNAATMQKLEAEILEGKRLADAAHTREQRAQEIIQNLRVSVGKMQEELDSKNKQLSEETTAPANKQQESLAKERERLVGEVDTLKQRLKTVSSYNQEVEQKLTQAEQRVAELQDKLDRQSSELGKERRDKDRLDAELAAVQDELRMRLADFQTAEDVLKSTTLNAMKTEQALKEQAQENEKNQKEIQKLMLKLMNAKTEADKLVERNDKFRKDLHEKNKAIKENYREMQRMREEVGRIKAEKENIMKKLAKELSTSSKAEENMKRMGATLKNAELEITSLKRQMEMDKKMIEKLNREKDTAFKTVTNLEDMNKKLTLEVQVYEQTNRKMLSSLEEMEVESNNLQRHLANLEKDKEKYILENQELQQQVEDHLDEVKLKRLEISDLQKCIAEGEARLRQQQTLFEDVRAERNSYKKNLSLAQDEIMELKNKVKNLNLQMDEIRDHLMQKEAALMKQEFLFGKTEKEKEALETELENCHQKISELRQEMSQMRDHEKNLRHLLHEAESKIGKQKKEIESVMNERDIIGTQIVRRNDELSLLYSKLQILTDTLNRGEKQYAQRLEDIRMLKLEIKKLRMDKAALEKQTATLNDMRGEVFHLERTLTKERLKVMALEEEVQNPLNVHRWRNLEGTNPDLYDLLKKTHFLQKRILHMSSEMLQKEKKIKETEKLYMELREIVARQPGPEVLLCLSQTRRALRDRGKKMKCLVAELNMSLSTEHKFELEKLKKELATMKGKYLAQKKRNQRGAGDSAKENLPALAPNPAKISASFHISTSPSINK